MVLDMSVLTAVASFFLAVNLKDEISCPATIAVVLGIPELKIGLKKLNQVMTHEEDFFLNSVCVLE